jgi:hypothetical protein
MVRSCIKTSRIFVGLTTFQLESAVLLFQFGRMIRDYPLSRVQGLTELVESRLALQQTCDCKT